MGAHVLRQAAVLRESRATGGADVGAVAGMGAHVDRQVAGCREALAAGGALEDALAPRLSPAPLAQPSRSTTHYFTRRLFNCSLTSDRCHQAR